MHTFLVNQHIPNAISTPACVLYCLALPGAQNSTGNLTLSSDGWPAFGPGFQNLTFFVESQTPTRVHIKVQPANNASRYQVPEQWLPR